MRYFLLLFTLLISLWAKPTYTIAIVSDGNTEYSQALEKALKTEIKQLLNGDFLVKFPNTLHKDGKWDYTQIASNINLSLKDSRSDMVIALGALSSHYIARKRSFRKPVIATAIIDPKMQKIPFKNNTSAKRNLTYVSATKGLDEDINAMSELMQVQKVAVLLDATLLKNTPETGRYIKKLFLKKGIKTDLIPITNKLQNSLNEIDSDVELVYVTPLFQQSKKEKKEIYERLTLMELPSFAANGEDDVVLGALFGNTPPADTKRFIRQIALDVQQIAFGSNASEQLVNFTPNPALSINMQTANDINYTPSWELLSKATIIKSEQSDSHFFTIEEIMDRAVSSNLAVIASEHKIDLSQAELDQSDSIFLPQIHIGAELSQIDKDRAEASLGLYNHRNADIFANFSQQLYNQQAYAKISVNENFLKAQSSANDYIKLDIGLSASLSYLRILQLRTKLTIEKNNLELSKTNLRSALSRRKIGIGHASDIYRWETQIANEKKQVLFTHSTLQQAKHTLNALLDLPQLLPLNFEPIEMNNKIFMTSNEEIKEYFLNQTKFAKFQSYLVKTAKQNMPNLEQYDALEEARDLIVQSNESAFYTPNISLEGGVKQHFIDAQNDAKDHNPIFSSTPYADNTDWTIGLFVRFPLYTGGSKSATLQASKAAYMIAQTQKKDLLNTIEKNVRNALYQAKASYLSIKLAESASKSSKKNLDLIKGIYAQGNIGILELLDAQHTALRSALVENNTNYAFMHDLLILQHDIGQVNFDLDEDEIQEFAKALNEHTLEEE